MKKQELLAKLNNLILPNNYYKAVQTSIIHYVASLHNDNIDLNDLYDAFVDANTQGGSLRVYTCAQVLDHIFNLI